MTLTATQVGQTLEPFVVEAVDPERIKVASAILDDPNPIHFDVDAVRRLGLGEATVNHGPINLAYLANVAVRFAGGTQNLRSFKARFLANVFAGDRVECRGSVSAIDRRMGEATLELTATVGDRQVMSGVAVVRLTD